MVFTNSCSLQRLTIMKKLLSILALSMPIATVSQAALTINVSVNRSFFMTAPKTAEFIEGSTSIRMYDGYYTIWTDCELDDPNGSPDYIPPITAEPFPDCPKGTTAQILSGDVNKDGIFDDRSFWSVATIESATYLEAFLPEQITLAAAPASKLKRPFNDFVDASLGLFFDVVSQEIYEYNIADYAFSKDFDNYRDHSDTWVPGVYQFSVPIRNQAPLKGPATMTITNMIEANGYRKGLKGFGIVTDKWTGDSMEMDPRIISTMAWEGVTSANTYRSDEVNFGIYDTTGNLVYPTSRGLFTMPSAYTTSFRMLPNAFAKGERGVCEINFDRAVITSGLANDNSDRSFFWNIHFIDSYVGHQSYEYRYLNTSEAVTGIKAVGVPSKLILPTADYDGDGLSNITEFAFTQDDGDDVSTTLEYTTYNQVTPPVALPATLVRPAPANAPKFYDSAALGVDITPHVTNKRAGIGGSITYGYEVNYDTTNPKSKWVKLKTPEIGGTLVVSDKKAATAAGVPSFTWTITDVLEAAGPPAVAGTTTIQASSALPSTVRVRATAAITKGY